MKVFQLLLSHPANNGWLKLKSDSFKSTKKVETVQRFAI